MHDPFNLGPETGLKQFGSMPEPQVVGGLGPRPSPDPRGLGDGLGLCPDPNGLGFGYVAEPKVVGDGAALEPKGVGVCVR